MDSGILDTESLVDRGSHGSGHTGSQSGNVGTGDTSHLTLAGGNHDDLCLILVNIVHILFPGAFCVIIDFPKSIQPTLFLFS